MGIKCLLHIAGWLVEDLLYIGLTLLNFAAGEKFAAYLHIGSMSAARAGVWCIAIWFVGKILLKGMEDTEV